MARTPSRWVTEISPFIRSPAGPHQARTDWRQLPPQTPCVHCRTVGFVRLEHIITGAESQIRYYCGRCHHSWTVDGQDERRAKGRPEKILPADPPDRSRP
jgi:hypothetical protein